MRKARQILAVVVGLAAAAALAAVPSTTYKNTFTGNGSTTAFAYTFQVQAASWVAVYLGDTKQTTGFTVAMNANQSTSPGGTVTFTTAPTTGTVVTVQRDAPLTQTSVWSAAAPFRAKTLETQLDKIVMQQQQVDGRTTALCEQVDQVFSLAQGPMGPAGPAGTNGTNGLNGSISSITQNLDFTNTYKNTNLAAPSAAGDSATKGYVDTWTSGSITWGGYWSDVGGTRLRVHGSGLVVLNLAAYVTTGGSGAGVGSLPAGFRPASTHVRGACWGNDSSARMLAVDTDGTMAIWPSTIAASTVVYCSMAFLNGL